jgi:hypothetical protein
MLFAGARGGHAACDSDVEVSWSALERRAWSVLVAGDVFDGAAAAADLGGQPELSAAFLRTILVCDRLVALLPESLVSLLNIGVREPLDLSRKTMPAAFECRNCVFRAIIANDSRWRGRVSLNRIRMFETFDLSHASLDSSLVVIDSRIEQDLALVGAEIAGNLVIAGESSIGELDAGAVSIGGSLELRGVDIAGHASFWGASLARDVLLTSNDAGRFSVIGSRVAGDEQSTPDIDAPLVLSFGSARIDRRISISDTVINGRVDLDAVRIAEDLWLRDCSAVAGPMNLVFARIGQNIDLSSALLNDIDLTGARIGGELRLGAPRGRLTAPVWKPGAQIVLRNVELSSWTDATGNATPRDEACVAVTSAPDPWPDRIDVVGFSYQNVGGLGGGSAISAHDVGWFCRWLERQTPFSLEPYQHAAAYLRRVGLEDDADDVLYCGKVREIDFTPSWIGKLLLQIQRFSVGFGYRIERSLIWAALFILVGQQIFSRTKEAKAHRMPYGLAYSIEMFIPALSLRRLHQEIDLTGWQRYYFYLHKFMGWVLGSLVVAGLAGLLGE